MDSKVKDMDSSFVFSPEYALTIIVIILVISMLLKKSPQMNTIVVIVIGLLVGYVFMVVVNFVLPSLSETVRNWSQYFGFVINSKFNDTGYINIWPPLFVVFVVFIILLYNRSI